jgi:nucleotide-binding universal stress UspA family protein
MKKILVPIDFSEVSGLAADFAVDMAEKSNAKLIFLNSVHYNYFVDFPVGVGVNIHSLVQEVSDAMKIRMEEFVKNLNTTVNIECRISHLHLLEAVKEIQKEEKIGLVIMGTQGSSGWSELLIGSNTERIVRWSECPVISVPVKTTFNSIKKILIAIDLKEVQVAFLERIAKLQKLFNAEMQCVWVKTPHNIENDQLVTNEMESLFKKHEIKNASFTIVKTVFPTDGIFIQAQKMGADMIAMATHSRRGITHWLNGSITEDTINHVHIPVWTFKLEKENENVNFFSIDEAKAQKKYTKKTLTL